MAAMYVVPEKVSSPKRRWSLIKVLFNEGEGGIAVAVGYWDGTPSIVMRWNGDDSNPIGTPQSRGLPTWFVVPSRFHDPIIGSLSDDNLMIPECKALVTALFPNSK